MFSCVPARSVDYYLRDTVADQLEYYWGGKQGVWWTPTDASATAQAEFAACCDGEVIDNDLFIQLSNGILPDGAKVATNGSGVRMPGYDCHFAPPKSVSLVFAFSDDSTRRLIVALHTEAVRRALQFIFDWGLIDARRGSAGQKRETVAGLIAAIFTEFTSRDNDPQLHSHAVIPNVGVRVDGTIGAIDNWRTTIFQHLVGAIYQAHVAAGMRRMGFSLAPEGRAFEVRGIPKQLRRVFSKRRNTIERVAAALGLDPSVQRSAAQVIALDTRPEKSRELPLEQLEARWRDQLAQAGFDKSSFDPGTAGEATAEGTPEQFTAQAVAEAFETSAVLSKAKLFSSVAERLVCHCDADTIERHLRDGLPPDVVPLLENEQSDNTLYSTSAIIAMEQELLRNARAGRRLRYFVASDHIEAAIAARPGLAEEQQDAIRHALNQDQISIVEGAAGSGKSFMLAGVAAASRAAGLDVWAIGPSWSAAGVLAADTQTGDERKRALTGFLSAIDAGKIQLGPHTVILLDEAGMAGTADMTRLVAAVRTAGCKLVLSGDTQQLSPVAAGAPMRLLVRVLGTSRMAQIRRQKLAWSRAASMEFFRGKTDSALKIYEARGHIDWLSGRGETLRALADRYVADILADRAASNGGPLPTCLAIATRNADVVELNREIRARLRATGLLNSEEINLEVALRPASRNKRKSRGSIKLAKGDRVVFGESVVVAARTIRNADVATVVAIDAGPPVRLTLQFEADGPQITQTLDQLVGFRAEHDVRLPMLRHAYAGTVHFSQGRTVDRAYIASIHAMSREAMYVAMTRHRHAAQLFVETSRLKSNPPSGLVKSLTGLLPSRAAQRANRAAQQEGKKRAFFQESLRPDSQANAADFVSDLPALLAAPAPDQSLPRREAAKARMQHRMAVRGMAEVGEAARFDGTPVPSGLPGWRYRWTHVSTIAVLGPPRFGRDAPMRRRPADGPQPEDQFLTMLRAFAGHLQNGFHAALLGLRSVRSSLVSDMKERRLQTKQGGYKIRQDKLQNDNPLPEEPAAGREVLEHEPDMSD
jgi:conjugative relaxase-like TrwC/TraI family protein